MVNIIIKTASATMGHTNILRINFNAFIRSLLMCCFRFKQPAGIVLRLRCLGAQRKGEVKVLGVIAAAFRVVEHNRQIAALPDFKGIIGGGNILPSSLLSSPLFCPNMENTG